MDVVVWLFATIGGVTVIAFALRWLTTLQARANNRTAPGSAERVARLRLALGENEGLIYFLTQLDNVQLGEFSGVVHGIAHALETGMDIRPDLYQQIVERGGEFPHRARVELSSMNKAELIQLRKIIESI